MAKRKAITKKTRFEVFKRDSFTCQYCGRSAPDVVLEVDHINPVANGGENEILNYATSCKDCNAGKSDRLLSDGAIVSKQVSQLKEISEKREQLALMIQWRNSLRSIEDEEISLIATHWKTLSSFPLTENGLATIRRYRKKHSVLEVMEAIDAACAQYLRYEDSSVTMDSAANAFAKIGGILRVKSMPIEKSELFYIRGILNNRFHYVGKNVVSLMSDAIDCGVHQDAIKYLAKTAQNWTRFRDGLAEMVAEEVGGK